MSNTFTDMTTAPSDAPAATQNVRRKYDSTVARIAGNLLSGVGLRFENYAYHGDNIAETAREAVRWARAIVAEVEKTEPK